MPFLLYPFVERRWQCATFISYHWWCSCAMWTVCVDDSRPLGLHCTQCHNDGVSATAVAVAAICMHQLKMLSKEIIIALREQKRRNFERSAWQPEYDFVFFFFLSFIHMMDGWMDGSCRAKIDQPNNGGMNETKTVFFSPNAISSTIISIDSSQCRIMSGAYVRACQRPDTYSGWFGRRVVGSKLSFFPHIFLMNCSRNMENWVDIAVVGTHCGHVFREFVSHV